MKNTLRRFALFLLIVVTPLFLVGRKYMPSTGVWRVVTLHLHTAFSETASSSGTISTDGTNVVLTTLGLSVSDITATGDITAGGDLISTDDVLSGDDVVAVGSVYLDDAGTGTEAFVYGSGNGPLGAASDANSRAKIGGDTFTVSLSSDPDNLLDTDVMAVTTAAAGAVMGVAVTLSNTMDLLAATDQGSDLGTEAKSFGAIYGTTLDVDTSINCDGSLVVDTTSTLTGAVGLNGGATLANTKDLLVATDGGSDVGAVAACVGTVFTDNIQGTTSTPVIALEGITLSNTKDIIGATDGGSDVGSATVAMGTVYTDSLQGATSTAVIATEGITVATGKDIIGAADGTTDLGSGTVAIGTTYTDAVQGASTVAVSLAEGASLPSGENITFDADSTSDVGEVAACAQVVYTDAIQGTTSTAVSAAEGVSLPSGKDITFDADSTSDVGAVAACAAVVYTDAVQGTTSTAVSASEGVSFPSGKDITFDADSTSDVGAVAACAAVVYTDGIQGTTSTAVDLLEGATLKNTKDLLVETDGGSDVGAVAACVGTVFTDNIQGTTSTATIALEGFTIATNKDIVGAADGTTDLGASGTELGTVWTQVIDDGDGTVTVSANLDTSAGTVALGANVPSMAVARTTFLQATLSNTTGAEEVVNAKATIALADAGADEHIYFWWEFPDDIDYGSDVTVKILYLCDNGTPSEGELNVGYLAVADDDADAGVTELTVLDTPAAQNDWNLTGAMTIPNAAIASGDIALALDVYHDVTDQLCAGDDINVAGIQIGYTSASNY